MPKYRQFPHSTIALSNICARSKAISLPSPSPHLNRLRDLLRRLTKPTIAQEPVVFRHLHGIGVVSDGHLIALLDALGGDEDELAERGVVLVEDAGFAGVVEAAGG